MLMNFHRQQYERFNVVSKSLRLIRNILFLIIFGYLGIMIFLTVIEDGKANFVMSSYLQEKANYVQVLARPTSLNALNADGTANGLNLALISQLNEGYIKDWLTIGKMSQDGTLCPDCEYKTPLVRLLGVAACEQGCYPGSNNSVIGSSLGWKDGKSVWDKGKKWTLYDSGSSDYDSGKTPYWDDGYVTSNDTGGYIGVFQAATEYFYDSVHYKKSSLSSDSVPASRSNPDKGFFPDQVAVVNWERYWKNNDVNGAVDSNVLHENAREMAVSILYSGTPILRESYTPHTNSTDLAQNLNKLADKCAEIAEKYKDAVNFEEMESQRWKWITMAIVIDSGGKISQESYNIISSNSYQRSSVKMFLDKYKPGTDVDSFLSSAVDPNLAYAGNATGKMSLTVDGVTFNLTPESFAHYIGEDIYGPLMYARMLQFGGVAGVDPTNPSTYMVMQKSNGQWTPDGNTDWMKEAQIDMSKLNDKRAQTLQYGHTWLHLRYISERPYVWPEFNADGTINTDSGVIDCSAFVICIIKKITGVDVGGGPDGWGNTDSILANTSACREVSPSEMKPGDLIVMGHGSRTGTAHVVMYLGGNCDRETTDGFWYMDTGSNDTGGVKVSGTGWAWQKQDRSTWYYLHVNAYGD